MWEPSTQRPPQAQARVLSWLCGDPRQDLAPQRHQALLAERSRGGLVPPCWAQGLGFPGRESVAIAASSGRNWFSSLSPPPAPSRPLSVFSLPPCLSSLPGPAHPLLGLPCFCRLRLLGAPPLLPSLLLHLALPAFSCLPQEVGTQPAWCPALDAGRGCPSLRPLGRRARIVAPPCTLVPTYLSPTRPLRPRPESPAFPAPPLPPRLPAALSPPLSPGPLPPLPFQGAG